MKQEKVMENIYVFDDGVIRGFIEMNGTQLSKIYVDSFFQSRQKNLVQTIYGHWKRIKEQFRFIKIMDFK